jgi:acyl-CoA thioesterase
VAEDQLPDPVRTMMVADAASHALGIEVLSAGDGRATCRMTVRDNAVNGHAIAHGGLIFALADTAFACACNSWGPVTVAAGAEIVFVAPARLGDELIAEAALRSRSGRYGVYDVTVRRRTVDATDVDATDIVAEFRGRSTTVREAR